MGQTRVAGIRSPLLFQLGQASFVITPQRDAALSLGSGSETQRHLAGFFQRGEERPRGV